MSHGQIYTDIISVTTCVQSSIQRYKQRWCVTLTQWNSNRHVVKMNRTHPKIKSINEDVKKIVQEVKKHKITRLVVEYTKWTRRITQICTSWRDERSRRARRRFCFWRKEKKSTTLVKQMGQYENNHLQVSVRNSINKRSRRQVVSRSKKHESWVNELDQENLRTYWQRVWIVLDSNKHASKSNSQ